MKQNRYQYFLCFFLFVFLTGSASNEQLGPELRKSIITNVNNPQAKTIEIYWTSNSNLDVGYHIQVAKNKNLPSIIFQDTLQSVNKVEIYNLYEATTYFLRIRAVLADKTTELGTVKKNITYLEYEEVNTLTSDDLKLNIARREAQNTLEGRPVLVFWSAVYSMADEWFKHQSRFLSALRDRGYVILTFDNRFHGKNDSDPWVNSNSVSELLTYPMGIPNYIEARSNYLNGRLSALIGSSMGVNLACIGLGDNDLCFKTSIAFSQSSDRVNELTSQINSFPLKSSLYFATVNDTSRAEQSKKIYNRTFEPRKIVIIEGPSSYGFTILRDHPDVWDDVFRWLGANC